MYYYVGSKRLFDSDKIKWCSIEDSLEYLSKLEEIGLDFETTGFDVFTKQTLSLQLGDEKNQFVINTQEIPIEKYYKTLIESKLIIGQNLKFDIRWLYIKGIIPMNVYDTYIAEQILYNNDDKLHGKALDALVRRYCGETLNKTIRGNIHREGLSDRVIIYGAKDVAFLHEIKRKQLKLAYELDVYKAIELDNLFVPVITYLEFCGIKLDRDLWQKRITKSKAKLLEIEKELNNEIIRLNITKFIDRQLDLFSTEIRVNINWNSSKQVIDLFNILGIDTSIVEKGEEKKSVSAKHIRKLANEYPIINIYIKYKELQKELSTYGENFYKHINPVTGRIHTNFGQLLNTGRMYSGGKDKANHTEYINMLNIPRDEDTRKCFVPERGNILIDCDYSGQEDIIFANKCQDKVLTEFYLDTARKRDGHSFVAKMCFPKELENISEEDVKKLRPDLRQNAKSARFAISYGGNGFTIANNLNISKEEGERIYNSYMSAFPGIANYFKYISETSFKNGYITFNNICRRKYWYPDINRLKELQETINRNGYNSLSKEEQKKYHAIKGDMYRSSLNFPIQGTGAEVLKYSMILLFRKIVTTGNFMKVKIVDLIYDEALLEVPIELSEEWALILKDCMETGAKPFCPIIPLKAEPCITPYWTH